MGSGEDGTHPPWVVGIKAGGSGRWQVMGEQPAVMSSWAHSDGQQESLSVLTWLLSGQVSLFICCSRVVGD